MIRRQLARCDERTYLNCSCNTALPCAAHSRAALGANPEEIQTIETILSFAAQDALAKDVSPMGIDRQFSKLPADRNIQELIEGDGTIQSAGATTTLQKLLAAELSKWCRTIAIVCGSALMHTIFGFQPNLASA